MKEHFGRCLDVEKIKAMSGLSLAYVGDAVYELMIRTWLCSVSGGTNGAMHAGAVEYVSAKAQAGFAEQLMPILTDEEVGVYKRGRNAHVGTIPIHATPGQYHAATGFEALFGYLWLSGRYDRLSELFDRITEENNAS